MNDARYRMNQEIADRKGGSSHEANKLNEYRASGMRTVGYGLQDPCSDQCQSSSIPAPIHPSSIQFPPTNPWCFPLSWDEQDIRTSIRTEYSVQSSRPTTSRPQLPENHLRATREPHLKHERRCDQPIPLENHASSSLG